MIPNYRKKKGTFAIVGVPIRSVLFPDSRFHGANMGPIGDRQDPGGPHVGLMSFAIWDYYWRVGFDWYQVTPDMCVDSCRIGAAEWATDGADQ